MPDFCVFAESFRSNTHVAENSLDISPLPPEKFCIPIFHIYRTMAEAETYILYSAVGFASEF